jgi:hypothetical protein
MNFHPGQVRNLERFGQQRADIIEMSQNARGINISFPTENFVAIDAEPVEKILLFGARFFHESRKRSFNRLQLSRMYFEVRVKADEVVRQRAHVRILNLALGPVERAVNFPSFIEYAMPEDRWMDCIARLVKRVSNRRLRINVEPR